MKIGDKIQIIKEPLDSTKIEKISNDAEIIETTEIEYTIKRTIIFKIKKEDESLIKPVTGV